MKVVCKRQPLPFEPGSGVSFSLFETPRHKRVGRIGATMRESIRRAGVRPNARAWDLLTVALSVAAADQACPRKKSPDGWTRDIQLEVALVDPGFWVARKASLESALGFLTGDFWRLSFADGGVRPLLHSRRRRRPLAGDSVCLLSGGVDSLVGGIDSVFANRRPVFVSQVARGDKERQRRFAAALSPSLAHLQLGHGIWVPGVAEKSQRARSIVFLAYGVLAASSLARHREGEVVDLLVPENGFISLNVPLTSLRLGSLSTRTTHPLFMRRIQELFDSCDLRVRLRNPYRLQTKGEMLSGCADQKLLETLVFDGTSCGRFARYKYAHCGRCVPCLVRRAAFLHWGKGDKTTYRFLDLSLPDKAHRGFDDVRSAAYAGLQVERLGVEAWAGSAVSSVWLPETEPYIALLERGVGELSTFLKSVGAA